MPPQRYRIGPSGLILLVCLLLAGGGLYAIARSSRDGRTTLARIEATGRVRIGYANEAPFGYLDTATGRITGEAPEIAREILGRMGANSIEPVVTEFGSLIPGLKAGRFDVIAAGMYITPERAREIAFSDPTYAVGETILVVGGNPLDLHSYADIAASPTARIAVMGGAVEHGYAKASGIPRGRILVFPDYPSAVEGLRAGRVDAVAATTLTAGDLLRKAGGDAAFEAADPFTPPDVGGPTVNYGAFGFRRGEADATFRAEFNRHLADFLGTSDHLELIRPFGLGEETLPRGRTAADVLDGT